MEKIDIGELDTLLVVGELSPFIMRIRVGSKTQNSCDRKVVLKKIGLMLERNPSQVQKIGWMSLTFFQTLIFKIRVKKDGPLMRYRLNGLKKCDNLPTTNSTRLKAYSFTKNFLVF